MLTHTAHNPVLKAVGLALCVVLLLTPPAMAQRAPRVLLTTDRVDATPGRPLLVPVLSPVRADTPPVLDARLDDGRTLKAELVRLSAAPDLDALTGPPGWLPPAMQWSASPPGATPTDPNASSSWFVLVHPPEDSAGQGLWIGGRRLDLAWLPDPYDLRVLGDELEAESPWASPSPRPWRDDAGFRSLIQDDRDSPLRRWRWKLAVGELAPTEPFGGHGAPPPIDSPDQLERALTRPPLQERAIEAFAAQLEARWQVALGLLHRADPETARRVRARLAGAADMTPGPIVPVFAPLDAGVDRLLDDLLNPRADDARRVALASAWLNDQASAVAWAIDDAGRVDATTGHPRPTIGVVFLPDDDQPTALTLGGAAQRATVDRLAPRQAVAARPDLRSEGRLATVDVEVGRWSAPVALAPEALPVRPPGLTIGPLRRAWTLDAWLRGREDLQAAPAPERACVAMLHRVNAGPGAAGWRLYVECLSPDTASGLAPAGDVVRVWLGPFASATSVLSVTRDGRVEQDNAPDRWIDVGRADDRWVFDLDLPPEAIEPDGVLRIAIERVDSVGERTSAPRRMLPWQREPGRLAIDTRAWESLDQAP